MRRKIQGVDIVGGTAPESPEGKVRRSAKVVNEDKGASPLAVASLAKPSSPEETSLSASSTIGVEDSGVALRERSISYLSFLVSAQLDHLRIPFTTSSRSRHT